MAQCVVYILSLQGTGYKTCHVPGVNSSVLPTEWEIRFNVVHHFGFGYCLISNSHHFLSLSAILNLHYAATFVLGSEIHI